MKVKLSKNSSESLDLQRLKLSSNIVYPVLGVSNSSYRLINDVSEPVLYEKEIFEVIDNKIPDHWVRQEFEEGEYYVDPPEFSEVGFFEDYFDGNKSAIKAYNRYLKLNGFMKNA